MGNAIRWKRKITLPVVFISIYGAIYLSVAWRYTSTVFHPRTEFSYNNETACPGVLSHMMRGYWKPYPALLQRELLQILQEKFLISYRLNRGIPRNLSRSDGKCGNITFSNTKFGVYRALCDPSGPTPCCYEGYCVSKSVQDCKCEDCFDVRQRIQAESSIWIPSDHRCHVEDFDSETACDILKDSTIFFSGNSLLRQIFMALTMILRGDLRHALQEPQKVVEMCDGLDNMVGPCQFEMEKKPDVCNGRVNITFVYKPHARNIQEPFRAIDELKHKPKTMIFLGVGLHDHYNYEKVYFKYCRRILKHFRAQNAIWPKFLWASTHATGLLKSPHMPSQSYKSGRYFNEWLKPRLDKEGVTIFDTFNMTDGVVSPDGCHHGLTVNMLKARFFLHYIAELQRKGEW
ncbi:uncharacterized protein LOC130012266 [Patella vulgata]|uniref:uncharacterized protein LOC130012266 n=1 Tax=Patella vulgata TaxID=6465 RepID=UPI0024A81B84|nr:uncharacterized protein LOC130012266 [Patella vulgata]